LEAHRAWALSEAGEREEAAERLHALLAEPDALRSGYLRRVALAFLAEATAALEDTTAAAQLAPWLHEETRHGTCVNMGAHAYLGALGRYEGLVALTMGRPDDAVGHHERALDVHEKMRARGWAARSRYDLARALLARRAVGDVERAVGLIESATDVARDLGMSRLLEEMSAVPLTPVRAPESR
jgi:tetratricopeptide (TPR) repeat protein